MEKNDELKSAKLNCSRRMGKLLPKVTSFVVSVFIAELKNGIF